METELCAKRAKLPHNLTLNFFFLMTGIITVILVCASVCWVFQLIRRYRFCRKKQIRVEMKINGQVTSFYNC